MAFFVLLSGRISWLSITAPSARKSTLYMALQTSIATILTDHTGFEIKDSQNLLNTITDCGVADN